MMTLNQGKQTYLLALVVFIFAAMGGGLVAAEPGECDPPYDEDCMKTCADLDATPQCISDSDNTDACVCNKKPSPDKLTLPSKDGGKTKVASTSDCKPPTDDEKEDCVSCTEANAEGEDKKFDQYTCTVTTFTDFNGIKGSAKMTRCACVLSEAQEQKGGRRRGKFPPILAQLLKALQQVRGRYSGRGY